jgi:Amt family ammonium transporter
MLGTFFAGIFASAGLGVFSGQGFNEGMTMGSQVGVQLIGIVSTLVYTAVLTYIIVKVVTALIGFRVEEEDETLGLDIALHDEKGYDL